MVHDLVRFQSSELLGSWQKLLPLEISLFSKSSKSLWAKAYVGQQVCLKLHTHIVKVLGYLKASDDNVKIFIREI